MRSAAESRSMNRPLSMRELDAVCCKFDSEWQPVQKLADLRLYAEQRVEPENESFNDLLLELVLIDVQKRWQYRAQQLMLMADGTNRLRTNEWCLNPPNYWEYAGLFSADDEASARLLTLAQAELDARWEFGDVPDIETYSRRIPGVKRPEVELPKVRILRWGQILFETELIGRTLVGRQDADEPAAPACHQGVIRKVVCADLTERFISRTQLYIECCCRNLIRLENGSEKRPISLGSDQFLSQGASCLWPLWQPLSIPLNDLFLVVARS